MPLFRCPLPEGGKRGETPALMLTLHTRPPSPSKVARRSRAVCTPCTAHFGQVMAGSGLSCPFTGTPVGAGACAERPDRLPALHVTSFQALCTRAAYVRIKRLNALPSFVAVNKGERLTCSLGCELAEDQGL